MWVRWNCASRITPHEKVTHAQCVHEHCVTDFIVFVNEREVGVSILNKYGSLKDAEEERWCTQLEEEVVSDNNVSADHEHFWYD